MRQPAKKRSLHPLERSLACIVITLLVFLPWAFGGMKLWSQCIALGLASLAFILALIPRNYTEHHHAGGNLRLIMWPKLVRFLPFWLGLAYFTLILCQIFNPAWTYRSSTAGWWLEGIPYIEWLPHGVEGTPFEIMDGWRTMIIHGAVWLLACALWVGLTRRKTIRVILYALAVNGLLVALTVLFERFASDSKYLFLLEPFTPSATAGFIYKNHAGAYLILSLAACFSLAWWHMRQAAHFLAKSHPGPMWAIIGLFILVGLIFTYARAATLVGVGFVLIVGFAYCIHLLLTRPSFRSILMSGLFAVVACGFVSFALSQLKLASVWTSFERLGKEEEFTSVTMRRLATAATLDMAADSKIFGHGAGSFRFLFPKYQQHYPRIYTFLFWTNIKGVNVQVPKRYYWEYAHNDFAQLYAECGLTGISLLALSAVFVLHTAWRTALFKKTPMTLLLMAPALMGMIAAVDFPFHNYAVMATAITIMVVAIRWAELDAPFHSR